jgi:uncharacterized protein YndB with AHSA1/START domain
MSDATSHEITITRIIDAPAEAVFKAWTEAGQLAKWFSPEGFTVPKAESEPRQGGAFTIVMRGPDGSESPMTGVYREFDPPRRLVTEATASLPDGRPALEAVTTVTLTDHDGKTELTVHERATALIPEAGPMLAGMEVGILQSLRRLDDVLTGAVDRQIVLSRMYEAPRERVFDAFTAEEHLQHWWGPNGFTITSHEFDMRPGGVWRFTMHGPDGVDYPNVITYRDIERPELLTYEHSSQPDAEDPPFVVAATFDGYLDMTILTMRMVFPSAADLAFVVEKYHADEGGTQTMERLNEFLKARHD